ncbi:hypothetical protein MPSEU_000168000 [Mayamaea pseudoterrestris]|nr:hypothetical protein MPSEU_000168000 [Mayamaea pseudoterrestris]
MTRLKERLTVHFFIIVSDQRPLQKAINVLFCRIIGKLERHADIIPIDAYLIRTPIHVSKDILRTRYEMPVKQCSRLDQRRQPCRLTQLYHSQSCLYEDQVVYCKGHIHLFSTMIEKDGFYD